MRLTSIALLPFLFVACSSKKPQEIPLTQTTRVVFSPSFLFASEIDILEGSNPRFTIKVLDTIKTYTKTFNITNEDLSALIQGIDSFNVSYLRPQSDSGLDGISVRVISTRLKANDTIRFWSPRRQDTEVVYYKLLDPVFDIMRKYMTADAEMMYVEQLEQYFDYGAPIKKIKERQYRIYGLLFYYEHVTNYDHVAKALDDLIEDIPADGPVIIDMSNFNTMGTFYYDHFKKLLAKNSRIKWIVNYSAREQLTEIGCPEANMEQSTKKPFGRF